MIRVVEREHPAGRLPHREPGRFVWTWELAQELRTAYRQRRGRIVLGELPAEAGAAPAREPPELGLALEDDRAVHATPRERPRGREAREPTPDDRDVGALG
jgi:hypothetical protein